MALSFNKMSSWTQYCASPRQMQYIEYKRGVVHRRYQSLQERIWGCCGQGLGTTTTVDGTSAGAKAKAGPEGAGGELGVTGEGCGIDLQRRYDHQSSSWVLFMGKSCRLQRERWKGTTSTEHLLEQEPSERERQDGWRLRGHLEQGGGPGEQSR